MLSTVDVLQKGQRGDAINTMVKVEFGEKVLGDTPKVECTPEAPAEFNFNTTINVTYEDAQSLIEVANKPVLCELLLFLYHSIETYL